MSEKYDRPENDGSDDRATERMSTNPESGDAQGQRAESGDGRDTGSSGAETGGATGSAGEAPAAGEDETLRMPSGEADSAGTKPPTGSTGTVSGDLAPDASSEAQGQFPSSDAQASGDQSTDTERIDTESDAERTQTISAISESDSERTHSFPAVGSDASTAPGQQRWVPAAPPGPPQPPQVSQSPNTPPDPSGRENNRKSLIMGGIVAGAVLAALLLLYIGDLAFSSGQVPRGTVVAGVEVGGMNKDDAEKLLKDELGPGLHEPVELVADDGKATIDPSKAGLEVDWAATVENAGPQSYNPFTRITSLFSTREVVPISHGDRERLTAELKKVKPKLDREASEGTIRFEGTEPVAVEPVSGRAVNVGGATNAVLAEWVSREPVNVPFTERPVSTTKDGVHKALNQVAKPAVSGPVTVKGEKNLEATWSPESIAESLRFTPNGSGGLKAAVDIEAAAEDLQPQLEDSIVAGKDARIVVEGGNPVVKPSVDGHGVDWKKSFAKITDVLKKENESERSLRATYVQEPAKFTTQEANKLGVKEMVSEFTTEGFEPESGVNIKRTAEQVDGAIVKPGETFSLNGHTGPRGLEQGYIESGIIEDGRPGKAVGGGISQFATTLYNASYFAGMQDVEHKEHSYYISRYPQGREATVFQNPDGSSVIDVKFKNISKYGILITTAWTPESITVQFWSTKKFDVSSETSERTEHTPPEKKKIPPEEECSPSQGTPGFTVFDTRTIKDVETGKVWSEEPDRTVYDPQPIIECPKKPGQP